MLGAERRREEGEAGALGGEGRFQLTGGEEPRAMGMSWITVVWPNLSDPLPLFDVGQENLKAKIPKGMLSIFLLNGFQGFL